MSEIDEIVKELSKNSGLDSAASNALGEGFGVGVPELPKTGDVGAFHEKFRGEVEKMLNDRIASEELSPLMSNVAKAAVPHVAKEIVKREAPEILKRLRGTAD